MATGVLRRIQNYSLDDVKDSIKYLLDRASESLEVRTLAIGITAGKPDPVAAIYDFIKQNVSYIPDPVSNGHIELFTSPIRMVRDYRAGIPIGEDCDGMAILATALYRSIGIRANVVLIDVGGNGLDHAYCQAYSDTLNDWVSVDPSSQFPLGWDIKYHDKVVV